VPPAPVLGTPARRVGETTGLHTGSVVVLLLARECKCRGRVLLSARSVPRTAPAVVPWRSR
jgi:hypothetical protein